MLEILSGNYIPTEETKGERGQFYIHNYQSSKYTYSSDIYVCSSIFTSTEEVQNIKSVYGWTKIGTIDEIDKLLYALKMELKLNIRELKNKVTEDVTELNTQIETLDATKISVPNVSPVPIKALENNTEYRLLGLGKMARLDFTLPDPMPEHFYSKVIVSTSDLYEPNFSHPDNVVFAGDDCKDGKFIPLMDKQYEIVYSNIGKKVLAKEDHPYIILAKVTSFSLR